MSENINLRPISELTEVDSVSTGDKILLNSNGEAKLIDASKVGGGIVYTNADLFSGETDITATAYTDEALTQLMDYATGKKLFMGGAVMSAPVPEMYKGYGLTALTGSLIAISYFDANHEMWIWAHSFSSSGILPQVRVTLKFSDT